MFFSQVIGQSEQKNRFIKKINEKKIAQTQLFIGRPGYGVLPLALSFIQYLFCENKEKTDSCGECQQCLDNKKLQHPDVHFSFPVVQSIKPTSSSFFNEWREMVLTNPYFDLSAWIKKIDKKERKPIIGKEESKEIINKISLKSFYGGHKVFLIWMPEEMNISCSNKLLKTLEEPPQKTIIILLASSTDKILKTIISRVQKTTIFKIKEEEMKGFLEEKKGLGEEQSGRLSSFSEGDVINMENLLTEQKERKENEEHFFILMRVCYTKKVLDMMLWAERIAEKSKTDQKTFLSYSIYMLRQSVLKNYLKNTKSVSLEEEEFIERFSKFITGKNIFHLTKTFNEGFNKLERNANSRILFTKISFDVMRALHIG